MKRRIITIAVSFLLCIGMVGAGFAAWVITGNTTDAKQGSIEVQEVVDKRLEISLAWKETGVEGADDDAKIIFGKHATDTCSWLANDSEVNEKLTATLVITVSNHKDLLDAGLTYDFTFALAETGGNGSTTGYSLAVGENLVGALQNPASVTASSATDDTVTYEVDVTFSWGTAFGGVNPITHYAGSDYAKDTADTVKGQLENLNTYLTGIGYSLTVTGTVTQANA